MRRRHDRAFDDADFVIEALFEEMGVKQKVLAELEEHVSAECVLATNTSSLSVSEMASRLEHPNESSGSTSSTRSRSCRCSRS